MARRTAAAASIVGLALAGVIALAGCVPTTPTPVPTETAAAPSATPTSTAPAEAALVEGGTAKQNQPYFDTVAQQYYAANGMSSSQGLADALVAAGFRKQDMEVTADHTSLGLQADSIVFSVRLKGECLIGDLQPVGYRSLIAPLLGTGGCLVGTTIPLG